MKNNDHTRAALIVRLPNWVGDVVMTLPALQALQKCGIELFLFGQPWMLDLLSATGKNLFVITNDFWQNTAKIANVSTADKALLLTNSFSSALMARLGGKLPVGYKTDGRRLLLNAGLVKPPAQHEVQYFWNIVRFAVEHWFPKIEWVEPIPTRITLPLSPEAHIVANQILHSNHIDKPFWVISPFARGVGINNKTKIWPYWHELSKELSRRYQLVICPGIDDEASCTEFASNAIILRGLNLSEYAAIMASAEQVIANDSGPMHIAAAVGAKTLGIFGASPPQRCRPWGADYIGSENTWPSVAEVLSFLSSASCSIEFMKLENKSD